ncbi:MAG: hypothetical protein EOP84_00175 [Verrucomicrobiaceae bacterium]|nr:MAG: hypothetical protein EOP84_00175 [Verrucomicrobiaceae bacterium]
MVSRRRATVSSAIANGANTLIVAFQSILLLPLFLRYIGKAAYGAWGGTGDILLWMQAFDLGLPNLMGQRIAAAHAQNDRTMVGRWLATGLLVLGVVSLLLIAVALGLSPFLPRLFSDLSSTDAERLSKAFALAGIGAGLVMINNGALVYARSVQRPSFLNAVMTGAALANLGVTLFFLLRGAGLYAIAYGILARSLLQSFASTIFVVIELRRGLSESFRFDKSVFGEAMKLMPATLLGGLAYAALNQSELLILNLTVGAVATASFLGIRRAAELVRALSDSVAFSSYSSFAHLVSSPDQERAGTVLEELTDIRVVLSIVLLTPYLAVNSSFVLVWLKGQVFPDPLLTLAIAAQTLVIGGGFLANYLYRASGELVRGSWFLALEAVVRVAAMYGLSKIFGYIGLPIGAIVTALPAWILTQHALGIRLHKRHRPTSIRGKIWAVRASILVAASVVGFTAVHASWAYVLGVATSAAAGAFLILLGVEPSMERFRLRLRTTLRGSAA